MLYHAQNDMPNQNITYKFHALEKSQRIFTIQSFQKIKTFKYFFYIELKYYIIS